MSLILDSCNPIAHVRLLQVRGRQTSCSVAFPRQSVPGTPQPLNARQVKPRQPPGLFSATNNSLFAPYIWYYYPHEDTTEILRIRAHGLEHHYSQILHGVQSHQITQAPGASKSYQQDIHRKCASGTKIDVAEYRIYGTLIMLMQGDGKQGYAPEPQT